MRYLKFALDEIRKLCPFVQKVNKKCLQGKVSWLSQLCPVASRFKLPIILFDESSEFTRSPSPPVKINNVSGTSSKTNYSNSVSKINEVKCDATKTSWNDYKLPWDASCESTVLRSIYDNIFTALIQKKKDDGSYRTFLNIRRKCGEFPNAIHIDSNSQQKNIKIWCGNDYLNMGQNVLVLDAAHKTLNKYGFGAGGTRNISGNSDIHTELEYELADWHKKEAALVFSSGYIANEATLSTLGKLSNCIFFSDEENHASIINGISHSRCKKFIFRHNDFNHLEELLMQHDLRTPKIIVFESIYSMSGDVAPMKKFIDLAKTYNALTYLDEVHAVGMYGREGSGIAEEIGVSDDIDIINGTLGKAIGIFGGYIASSKLIIDTVRSYSSGFIFTTSLPPVVAAGALASIKHLRSSTVERSQQNKVVAQLRQSLARRGIPFINNDSHIVPVLVNSAVKCKAVSDYLLKKYNIYLQPINYPTVPRGSERLRLTANPLFTYEDIEYLADGFDETWDRFSLPRAFSKIENNNVSVTSNYFYVNKLLEA